jgi:hypothetical protein
MTATDLSCTECHNDTTQLTGKQAALSLSLHGTGTAFVRGTSASCAGCHSGGAFSERIAAGHDVEEVEAGDPIRHVRIAALATKSTPATQGMTMPWKQLTQWLFTLWKEQPSMVVRAICVPIAISHVVTPL